MGGTLEDKHFVMLYINSIILRTKNPGLSIQGCLKLVARLSECSLLIR
jgi:hypothetical protein